MKEFVINLKHEIEKKIQTADLSGENILANIRDIICHLQHSLTELRIFIANYEFKNEQEEITFFKELKPHIYGQLLYFVRLYKIEERRPRTNKVAENVYITNELRAIDEAFTNSLGFYKYYRSGATSSDRSYFLRKEYDWALDKDPLSFEKDSRFSTSYDYEVANIIANDLLKVYLTSQLKISGDELCLSLFSIISKKQMQWTDTKVSLIELIYSIHACKSVNHGTVDLKDLIMCFEILFNIKMGDCYRTFIEIRERKKSRTQYIDQMKKALIEKMDDVEK